MGLLKDLQDAAVEQRKAMMAKTGGEHATYLPLVLSQAYAIAKKDGNRVATDADVEQAIRAEMKQSAAMLKGDPAKGVAPLPESDYRTQVQSRHDYLAGHVPPMLEGADLEVAIRSAAADAGVIPALPAMGVIMSALKANFGARVDGAQVKALLSAGV
jgi:uncharacterized protein YqeY